MAMASTNIPCYILLSQSSVQSNTSVSSSELYHPTIQYYYSDDSTLTLLPNSPDEQVVIVRPADDDRPPEVVSTSPSLMTTTCRVHDAPGADEVNRSNKMHIIETMILERCVLISFGVASPIINIAITRPSAAADVTNAHELLTKYKERSGMFTRALGMILIHPAQERPS